MRATCVRVVDCVDIAGHHVALEDANDVFAGKVQRADVHRDVIVALRNRIAFGIMQRV